MRQTITHLRHLDITRTGFLVVLFRSMATLGHTICEERRRMPQNSASPTRSSNKEQRILQIDNAVSLPSPCTTTMDKSVPSHDPSAYALHAVLYPFGDVGVTHKVPAAFLKSCGSPDGADILLPSICRWLRQSAGHQEEIVSNVASHPRKCGGNAPE
jgi:hypothetical protein